MPTVFVSDAVQAERLPFPSGLPADCPPLQHWKLLSSAYRAGLTESGFSVEGVLRPEIYQTETARRVRGVSAGDWHLAVKPVQHVRPFHGIPNVFVSDWSFPELSTSSWGVSPFLDQLRLLRAADAVACCTPFTMRCLRGAGVERAVHLAPYVSTRGSDLRADGEKPVGPPGTTCFLSVLHADSPPRALRPVIEGFLKARARRDDLRLVLVIPATGQLACPDDQLDTLRELGISGPMDGSMLAVVAADATQIADHLEGADFFLSARSARGVSPLAIQAMLAGVPLITTTVPEGRESLADDAFVRIPTSTTTLDEEDEPLARFLTLKGLRTTAEAACGAVLAAAGLGRAARMNAAAQGRLFAEREFGLAAFRAGMEELKRHLPECPP